MAMSKKKTNNNINTSGIVYSTDPDFKPEAESSDEERTLPAAEQKLRVMLDKKQRAGKAVTLIEGYSGKTEDLESLGKTLKTFCGTGGSVKDGLIIIQGDQRDKVLMWLQKNGFKLAKKVG
jgi:translation initiation factor 1